MSEMVRYEIRIDSLKVKLNQLLKGRELRWKDMNKSFWEKIPKKPGIYVIFEEHLPIYVGESTNLRNRLQTHGRGNTGGDTFHNKLYKNQQILKKKDREKFVYDRCCFKFFEVEGKKDRYNFEHFAIAVLEPELND